MHPITHILIATDGSDYALKAARFAATIAKVSSARITVLTVHHEDTVMLHTMGPAIWPGTVPYGSMSWPDIREAVESHAAKSVLEPCVEACGDEVALNRPIQLWGQPADEICTWAEENEVDLIVLGTRGKSGFARLLLGSTTLQVANHAPCPVTLIR